METPPEKPYELIPFASATPQRTERHGHHRIADDRLTGHLDLSLVTLRPVQVASGFQDFVLGSQGEVLALRQTRVQRQGDPKPTPVYVLPGSSIKGAVRSLVEAISPSCISVVSRQTRPAIPPNLSTCREPAKLCPACRLFGMSGAGKNNYFGQVNIEDATAPPRSMILVRTPLLWTPARGGNNLPLRYTDKGQAKGRKVYYHGRLAAGPDARLALNRGVTLPTTFHFQNLTTAELGLLLTALGLHPDNPFPIKLGAGKPVGMGSVDVKLNAVVLTRSVKPSGRLGGNQERLADDALGERVRAWTTAADQARLVVGDALTSLKGVLGRDTLSRTSPSDMY